MSRRHSHHRDPTWKGAATASLQTSLGYVLATLPDETKKILALRFGLDDGKPRTRAEVARALGLSENAVQWRENVATRGLLRDGWRIRGLLDHLDGELSAGVLNRAREFAPLVFCDRHGWAEAPPENATGCAECPCATNELWHARRYCSDACRQAAYRRRRRGPAS